MAQDDLDSISYLKRFYKNIEKYFRKNLPVVTIVLFVRFKVWQCKLHFFQGLFFYLTGPFPRNIVFFPDLLKRFRIV